MKPHTSECADRRVMKHKDKDNDVNGLAQADVGDTEKIH